MLETYALNWKNKQCGVIKYDTITRKLSATLLYPENGFPAALFGLEGEFPQRDDKEFRFYIRNMIVPPTRENIDDILTAMNLKSYDEWEIYKKIEGRANGAHCSIELISVK